MLKPAIQIAPYSLTVVCLSEYRNISSGTVGKNTEVHSLIGKIDHAAILKPRSPSACVLTSHGIMSIINDTVIIIGHTDSDIKAVIIPKEV